MSEVKTKKVKPNKRLVLVSGASATGKSASLASLAKLSEAEQKGVYYLNCESGKDLPFKNKFKKAVITDPMKVYTLFDVAEKDENCSVIIIDTLTFLMNMFETLYVLPHAGTKEGMTSWGRYAEYFRVLMQNYVAKSTKTVIILAHTSDVVDQESGKVDTCVKVKGSLMTTGIESYFSTVISTKKEATKTLEHEDFKNSNLNITGRESRKGIKYVFQTDTCGKTIGERMRGPMGMWEENELYIDNDITTVIDRLNEFYE